MYHPTRGGVRGGADQFSWEEVKLDKHRENYLGHSLKAPVGRWQKGKDLTWYAKDRDDDMQKQVREEMTRIKAAEENAMLAALGHKPVRKDSQPLSKEELSEALKRNYMKRDGERISGVGLASGRTVEMSSNNLRNGVAFQQPAPVPEKDAELKESDETTESSSKKNRKRKNEKKHKKKKHKKRSIHESSECEPRKKRKMKRVRHDSDSDNSATK